MNLNIYIPIFQKNRDSTVKINIRLWKKHQQVFCDGARCVTGQGQVTGVTLAQHHSLLKVRCDKNSGRCRWQREKQNGSKLRAQLGSRERGLDSKPPKKPCLEILQILVSRRQKCGAWR